MNLQAATLRLARAASVVAENTSHSAMFVVFHMTHISQTEGCLLMTAVSYLNSDKECEGLLSSDCLSCRSAATC